MNPYRTCILPRRKKNTSLLYIYIYLFCSFVVLYHFLVVQHEKLPCFMMFLGELWCLGAQSIHRSIPRSISRREPTWHGNSWMGDNGIFVNQLLVEIPGMTTGGILAVVGDMICVFFVSGLSTTTPTETKKTTQPGPKNISSATLWPTMTSPRLPKNGPTMLLNSPNVAISRETVISQAGSPERSRHPGKHQSDLERSWKLDHHKTSNVDSRDVLEKLKKVFLIRKN